MITAWKQGVCVCVWLVHFLEVYLCWTLIQTWIVSIHDSCMAASDQMFSNATSHHAQRWGLIAVCWTADCFSTWGPDRWRKYHAAKVLILTIEELCAMYRWSELSMDMPKLMECNDLDRIYTIRRCLGYGVFWFLAASAFGSMKNRFFFSQFPSVGSIGGIA